MQWPFHIQLKNKNFVKYIYNYYNLYLISSNMCNIINLYHPD